MTELKVAPTPAAGATAVIDHDFRSTSLSQETTEKSFRKIARDYLDSYRSAREDKLVPLEKGGDADCSIVLNKINRNQGRVLEALVGWAGSIEISYLPNGGNSSRHITLDADAVKRLGDHPIRIDGRVLSVTIPDRPVSEMAPLNLRPTASGGFSTLSLSPVNGMNITVSRDVVAEDASKLSSLATVRYTPVSESGEYVRKVDLDVRHLFLPGERQALFGSDPPVLKGLIEPATRPIASIGPYRTYSDGSPEANARILGERGADLFKAAATAEMLFGVEPGSFVKRIEIQKTGDKYDASAEGGSVRVSMTLAKEDGKLVQGVTSHEAAHLIDAALGDVSSTSAFQRLWKQVGGPKESEIAETLGRGALSKDGFLSAICEASFFPKGFGGHAFDSEKELFASLTNSIVNCSAKEWLAIVREKSPAFRAEYRDALSALREALLETGRVKGNAPIIEMVENRIDILAKL